VGNRAVLYEETDGQTDIYDETNSRFSKLCKRAYESPVNASKPSSILSHFILPRSTSLKSINAEVMISLVTYLIKVYFRIDVLVSLATFYKLLAIKILQAFLVSDSGQNIPH
jgi:hypothetical protein